MAKKRKAARPARKASRSVKKKSAPRRAAAAAPRTGLEKPGKVDFNPLKVQIGKHIAKLEAATVQNDKTAEALRVLKETQVNLSSVCLAMMELQTS